MTTSARFSRATKALTASIMTLAAYAAWADVTLPAVFSDHMVLQRDKALPIWGWAQPGESIAMTLAGAKAEAKADAQGRWRATLPALPAGGPHTLTVNATNTVTISDILVGDVWVCSGQSNMEWPLGAADGAQQALAEANIPAIRFFRVDHVTSPVPLETVKAAWALCTADVAQHATAIGYFFGREIQEDQNVAIGLIDSNWGGTRIEPWTPPEGFAAVDKTQSIYQQVMLTLPSSATYKERMGSYLDALQTWLTVNQTALADEKAVTPRPEMPAELQPLNQPHDPAALYNAMIHPLVPFAIRGAIWYQGESNRFDAHLYYYKMHALIKGWRSVWNQGDFPFYWVQLAPFVYGNESPRGLARIWEAQTMALDLPNTGMAVINDIGNLGDIHPRNKIDVGHRLALIAKANTYGQNDIIWSGPTLKQHRVDGNRIVLTFDHVGDGLLSRNGEALTWFELIAADGTIAPASATIEGKDTVIVTAEGVTDPVGVRFAWNQTAEPNLVNSAGLPTGAFRAGDVEPRNAIVELTPMAAGFVTAYVLDIPVGCGYNDGPVNYTVDNSKELTVPFDQIAYCLETQKKDGPRQFIFVSMNAFTDQITKIGVPSVATNVLFQQDVGPVAIASNVEGIPVGTDVGVGSIEFWPSNYGPHNQRPVPGASSSTYDFGDAGGQAGVKGYGSMQIHLPAKALTLMAFNRWGDKGSCELGIGNSPEGNPDWTFQSNADTYTVRRLTVLIRIDR